MAKKSLVARNQQRKEKVARYRKHRDELRRAASDISLTDEERFDAMIRLQKLPRDSSPSRLRNRCRVTGRPRGNMRKFQMSRITFRDMASNGLIPGVTKSSW